MKKFLIIVGLLTIVATPAFAQKSVGKTIVSGGDNMGTYIEAVEANFGKPNVTVTLPTTNAGEK
jgi:hypothetical protein